jgi:hypothetical protein
MNPETQKKLVELGFTEDKPGHFTLSRCGYVLNAYVKPEKHNLIWIQIPYDDGYSIAWPLDDCPDAVSAALRYFNEFVDLNAARRAELKAADNAD